MSRIGSGNSSYNGEYPPDRETAPRDQSGTEAPDTSVPSLGQLYQVLLSHILTYAVIANILNINNFQGDFYACSTETDQ